MVARCIFAKVDAAGVTHEFPMHISSLPQSLIHEEVEEWYDPHVARIIQQLDAFTDNGSDLDLVNIERVFLKLTMVDNSDGQGLFALPRPLALKKAVVNVDTASECFKYALLSILHNDEVSSH